jgi:hypothetical protein
MGEHIEQAASGRALAAGKQAPETMGRRLLAIVVYDRACQIGGTVSVDDLAATEIGDWTMPSFRTACSYAASQGWLIITGDTLTLTIAGLRAA